MSTAAKSASTVRMEAWRQGRWSQWAEGQSEESGQGKRAWDRAPASGALNARMRRCLILRQGASPLRPPGPSAMGQHSASRWSAPAQISKLRPQKKQKNLDRDRPSHGSRDRQGVVASRPNASFARCFSAA